jgi:hypothetical protein
MLVPVGNRKQGGPHDIRRRFRCYFAQPTSLLVPARKESVLRRRLFEYRCLAIRRQSRRRAHMNRAGTRKYRDEIRQDNMAPGLWKAVKAAASNWLTHKSPKAGASLAYYSVFSMGPVIVVVISIASLVLQREGVQRAVVDSLTGLLGNKGGEAINTTLQAAGKPSEGIFATVIGTATLIFAALGVGAAVQMDA